ncbi:midas domain-containing protein [Halorubrum salsamenti]|nr:hypothetical protein [Halorubrum salsamenti]
MTNGDTVNVSATVTDGNGVDSVAVDASALGGGQNLELTQQGSTDVYSATFDVSNTDSGQDTSVSLTVTAADTAGNENTGSDTVQLDTAAPNIDTFSANFDGDKTVTVTLSANEALDANSIAVNLNNSSDQTVATLNSGDFSATENADEYSASYTFNQKFEESFSANLSAANDVAGNAVAEPGLNNDTVDVDTSALDLTIDSPTSQLNLMSDSEFDLQYSYSDTNPDNVTVGLSTNEDGSNPTYTYDIDDSQYANDNANKTLTIDLSENEESDTSDLAEGKYYVTVEAEDSNTGTASTASAETLIVVDDTEPTIENFEVDDDSSTETNFSADISDTTSGVNESSIVVDVTQDDATQTLSGGDAGVEFADGTLTVDTQNSSLNLSEDPVTVNYTAEDYSGNVAENDDNTFTINTAPPAIDIVDAEAGEDEVTVKFTENVTANDENISKDDFAYTDVSDGDATEIDSVSATTDDDGYTDEVTLTLDEKVGVADLGADEVNVREGSLSDNNDNNVKSTAATTVALEDPDAPGVPNLEVGNVTAQNEGEYNVTVMADTAATANITVKNSSGDVFVEKTNVDLDASSSVTEAFNLTDIENGDVTIEATVNDLGIDRTSEEDVETVQKDNVSATIESVQTDAGTDELVVTFSEDVKNVDGNLDAENLSDYSVSGNDATYTLTVDEPIAPSDIDSESVTVSANTEITDIVGTQADTSAVSLEDGETPSVVAADSSNGSDTVELDFSESVYNGNDEGLSADNVSYMNNSGVSHSIESVEHTAGAVTATVTLDSALTPDDMNSDEIEVTANDSVDKQTTTSEVIEETVDIDDFEVSNATDASERKIQVSFTADEELGTFDVSLSSTDDLRESDEDDAIADGIDLDDFEVEEQDGVYTYTYEHTVPRDGEFSADLTSATAIGGTSADETPDDTTVVDTQDPNVVDAEIVDAGLVEDETSGTAIAVQFDEPVSASDGFEDPGVTLDGDQLTVRDVYTDGSDQGDVYFIVEGHTPTGDAPSLSVTGDSIEERHGLDVNDYVDASSSTTLDTHEFYLANGSNFVSVPAEFGSLDIADSEFSDMSVMTYEDGEWVSYAPDKTDNQDIESMEGGQGYVVNADSDATVDVTVRNEESGDSAQNATPGQQQLQEGWNLVGHWQEGTQPAADDPGGALDSVGGDSTATNVYGQEEDAAGEFDYTTVTEFEPGEAYWVFLEDDEVYTASNYAA